MAGNEETGIRGPLTGISVFLTCSRTYLTPSGFNGREQGILNSTIGILAYGILGKLDSIWCGVESLSAGVPNGVVGKRIRMD